VDCYNCPGQATHLEPVPGSPGKVRPACPGHAGPLARPADQADMEGAGLFGTLLATA
jgi:hypothetical protein